MNIAVRFRLWTLYFIKQLLYRLLEDRMDNFRSDLRKGAQDKISVMHISMGDCQFRFIDDLLSEQDDIQVNDPWSPMNLSYPLHLFLYVQQHLQQLSGLSGECHLHDSVQKGILVGESVGLGTIPGRGFDDFYSLVIHQSQCLMQILLFITHVRAQGHIDSPIVHTSLHLLNRIKHVNKTPVLHYIMHPEDLGPFFYRYGMYRQRPFYSLIHWQIQNIPDHRFAGSTYQYR